MLNKMSYSFEGFIEKLLQQYFHSTASSKATSGTQSYPKLVMSPKAKRARDLICSVLQGDYYSGNNNVICTSTRENSFQNVRTRRSI
jgi:hypothetical protein